MNAETAPRRPILRIVLIAVLAIALGYAGYTGVKSWAESRPAHDYVMGELGGATVEYPDARFVVMSDLHYYDPSLGTSGAAFEDVLGSDRKLLKESIDLVTLAVDEALAQHPDFVIVPGDLTKDGEVVNHEGVRQQLRRLLDAGIPTYVVPGNHDYNNTEAFRFEGDQQIDVPAVSKAEFRTMYADFGHDGDAIMADTDSLSYVAEPVPGLWLLALDTNTSDDNVEGQEPLTGGALSAAQYDWLLEVLEEAASQGKSVIAMGHHGVIEHWNGQKKLHPEYLIDDFGRLGEMLASWGVRAWFSGHYHAQDIVRADYGDNGFLYDVETGSIATAPCPMRLCETVGGEMQVTSTTLSDRLHPGTDFAEKARAFVLSTIESEAYDVSRGYSVNEGNSAYIADRVAPSFVIHYEGDEDPADIPTVDTSNLNLWGKFIWSQQVYVVEGLSHDPAPADNDVTLDLRR